ncbi:unnamed protein product [Symbiodinium microadriaticum]|nr:unnamed protein product [Symbiodinium microadriaticum]
MESEEDAKDTLLDLKLKKRTFKGASVKARLKTETVIRSYYPVYLALWIQVCHFQGTAVTPLVEGSRAGKPERRGLLLLRAVETNHQVVEGQEAIQGLQGAMGTDG